MTHDELQAIKARAEAARAEPVTTAIRVAGELAAEQVLNTDVPQLLEEIERLRLHSEALRHLLPLVFAKVEPAPGSASSGDITLYIQELPDEGRLDWLANEILLRRAPMTTHARTDVPALVAEVERLREALKQTEHAADFHIGATDISERKREACRLALRDAMNALPRDVWTRIADAHGIEFVENTTPMK